MWFLAAWLAAQAAEPSPPVSLATQLKRGLLSQEGDFGEVRLERIRIYPEVVRLSERKIELLLNGDEWFAIGVAETREHGRLRVTCHVNQCIASSGDGVSIELALVKEVVPPRTAPRRKPRARPAES